MPDRGHDILHIDKIPRLRAIPVDRNRLPPQRLFDEDRHRRRIGPTWILARPEHIEKPQRRSLHLAFILEKPAPMLPLQLRNRIGTFGLGQHGFRLWHHRIIPIHRRRTGKKYLLHSRPSRRPQHLHHPHSIHLLTSHRFVDRHRNTDHSRKVKNIFHSHHRPLQLHLIQDTTPPQINIHSLQIPGMPRRHIIQHPHLSLPLKRLHQMTADKAGSTSN